MTHGKRKKQKSHLCPRCRERKPRDAFPTDHGQRCKACGGRNGPRIRSRAGRSSRSRQATLKLDSCRRIVRFCDSRPPPPQAARLASRTGVRNQRHTTRPLEGFCDASAPRTLRSYRPASPSSRRPGTAPGVREGPLAARPGLREVPLGATLWPGSGCMAPRRAAWTPLAVPPAAAGQEEPGAVGQRHAGQYAVLAW
jgi:hypothetical protein